MKNIYQNLQIDQIIILTENQEIMVSGLMRKDHLRYKTEFYIDSTQLNRIINSIQSVNPEIEVSEKFISRSSNKGQEMYYLDGKLLDNDTISCDFFELSQPMLQIRA